MKIKGWFLVVISGLILIAAAVLIIPNIGLRAEFSLYGRFYRVNPVGDKMTGGVNTALLMVLCVAFGVITPFLVKVFFRGLGLLRKAGKEQRKAEAAARKVAASATPKEPGAKEHAAER